MEGLWNIEINFTLFLQNLGPWLVIPFKFFTTLGNEEFYLLVMPALYWCIDAALGIRVAIMLMLSGMANTYFKLAFRGSRPYWFDGRVKAMSTEPSFGFPSGHSQNAVTVWGLIAYKLHQRWAWIAAFLIVFFIGLSRIYLGVHFATDVFGGWIIGALMLWGFTRFETPVLNWVQGQGSGRIIFGSLILTVLMVLISAVLVQASTGWQIPATWTENALNANPNTPIAPFDLNGSVTSSGTLFGIVVGAVWLFRNGGFQARGTLWKKTIRYLIGIAGVAVLWYGLGAVFPRTADLFGYSLRYFRYTLVGIWVAALAPAIFIWLHLAEPFDPPSG